MKLLQLIAITLLILGACQAQTYDTTPLLKKNHILSMFLKHTFGDSNPFRDRCITVSLTAELHTHLVQESLPENTVHIAELERLLTEMEPTVNYAIESLAGDHSDTDALKAFTQVTNRALSYIHTHLGHAIPSCKNTQHIAKKTNRFLGTVAGVSIASGAMKYILLAIGGVIILGMLRSIYKTITYEVNETVLRAKKTEQDLSDAIDSYCTVVHNAFCPTGREITPVPQRAELHGNWFSRIFGPKNIHRRFSNWRLRRRREDQHSLANNVARVQILLAELSRLYPEQQEKIQEARHHFSAWSPALRQ